MDWFNSRYSDMQLAEILSDYSKAVWGYRNRMYGHGRCTLVRELEILDAEMDARKSDPHTRVAMEAEGWLFSD